MADYMVQTLQAAVLKLVSHLMSNAETPRDRRKWCARVLTRAARALIQRTSSWQGVRAASYRMSECLMWSAAGGTRSSSWSLCSAEQIVSQEQALAVQAASSFPPTLCRHGAPALHRHADAPTAHGGSTNTYDCTHWHSFQHMASQTRPSCARGYHARVSFRPRLRGALVGRMCGAQCARRRCTAGSARAAPRGRRARRPARSGCACRTPRPAAAITRQAVHAGPQCPTSYSLRASATMKVLFMTQS